MGHGSVLGFIVSLTPIGRCPAKEGVDTSHKEHPYTMKIYPFYDGKPHSLVSDSIDQQKLFNELNYPLYVDGQTFG